MRVFSFFIVSDGKVQLTNRLYFFMVYFYLPNRTCEKNKTSRLLYTLDALKTRKPNGHLNRPF